MKGNTKRQACQKMKPTFECIQTNLWGTILDSNAPKPSNLCCNFHAVYSALLEIWIINAFYASPICTIHKDVKAPSLHYIVNSFVYVMACMSVRYRPRFLNKLGIKPHMHLLEIGIFPLYISCNRHTYQNYEQRRQKLGTLLENNVL